MQVGNLTNIIINTAGFSIFGIVFWLFPGLKLLAKTSRLTSLERVFLATVFGFSLYTALMFVLRLISLPFWIGFIPFILLVASEFREVRKKIFRKRIKLTVAQKVFLIIAICGVFIQGAVLFRSGIQTQDGIIFTELSFHDSIWHVFLIDELKDNFPPRHAGFAPLTLKNYHFLLDLSIASMEKYFHFSTFELYYRIVPAFVSLLLSLGVFVFSRRLSQSEWVANTAVFLTLFSGNASWFVKFFRGPEFKASANTFMLDPIIDLLQNPHAVIVFPMMLAGIMSLKFLEKRPSFQWSLISIVVFGVMIGFKAWGGTLMLLSLPLAAAWLSFTKQRHDLWVVCLGAALITLIIFLPFYDAQTAARPIFSPGWLLKRMVEDPDRYNMPKYFFLEQHYQATNNILRLILLNSRQFLIYILGNLWIKIIGLAFVYELLKKKTAAKVFMLSVTFLSLTLPVLFNQGRMSYDIIQFAPYGIVLMSLFTAVALHNIYRKIPTKTTVLLILMLLLLSTLSNKKSVVDRTKGDTFLVPNKKLEAFEFLKNRTDPMSIVMVYPSPRNISSALVAALSHRQTYFSAITYSRITGEDYEGRSKELEIFFRNVDLNKRHKAISENSIDYIYLTREEDEKFIPSGLDIEKVFSNEETSIYKIK